MDALRKQAFKFREQVAKQQQAVIKQFSGTGYESSDVVVIDEIEMQRHQQLDKLYKSTRSGRDFQRDFVKAAEAFTAIGYKHIEAGTKFSEECCRYGTDNSENINENVLAKAAAVYGDGLKHVEKEQEDLIKLLSQQVLDPLRAMVGGAPLEDARHLAQRYSRMRQEAEAQAAEISRRQARIREAPLPENVAKLHAAEARMQELKQNMAVLGKEASAALAAVEAQQQRLTLQRLLAMVEGEKTYHLRVAAILNELEAEMVSEKQRRESAPPVIVPENGTEKTMYYLAEAMHPFVAASEKELSLAVGDFVVVRKVSPSGWSEGECKGKAGWFPSAYVEKRQRLPSNNNGY
ncbi:Neutrophil cytosol factor 2 p67phox [Corchorus olitorius]|uniref:Neutrophil cytosol factor 2 p67phox n=1 Tax=Corchorus olitorius TaxID=93759 RepID=A0A1R3IJS2_9ROSI|nr:Neutrophil cytosol factor 2 p67phox [Corchorus olitorius]